MKTCEECGSGNYCKHCSTCHDCLNEHLDKQEQQLALAKAEIAELRAGIEYAIDNFGYCTKKTGKLLSYNKQELEIRHLMNVLAKHKGA